MAVFPRKYGRSRGSDKGAVAALEAHIKYMEQQIEFFASQVNKEILELRGKIEEQEKTIAELSGSSEEVNNG
jgi:prefoldin subunit 5